MPISRKAPGQPQVFDDTRSQDALSKLKTTSEEEQTALLANDLGLPYLDLNIYPINIENLHIISEEQARKGNLVIINKAGKNLKIAITDPKAPETLALITHLQKDEGYVCDSYLVSRTGLSRAIDKYKLFNLSLALDDMKVNLSAEDLAKFEADIKELLDLQKRIDELPTTEILNVIIAGAVKMEASDIHLEPGKESVTLRYRLDGVLQKIAEIPFNVYPHILNRIKMLSGLKLNIRDRAQDGRFEIKVNNPPAEIDVRVSLLPGNFGENVVARLLNQNMSGVDLDRIGLSGRPYEQLMSQIQKPNGMILNTGPTGSGKTTTLYACLKKVNTPENKVITIEDPIEYRLPGISQTQVHKERGYDFASGLRAIVRQDPDVLLVGEIRDEETADIATHAALTGHLVFSTVHANSAAGAIPRLIDLGVRPSLISPSINAIIAQRLVRRLCPDCKEEYVPASQTLEMINRFLSIISPKAEIEIPKNIKTLFRSKGCPKCRGLGFKGRLAIFEILEIDKSLEKLILDVAPASDIAAVAMENGMITILQDGILKAVAGDTSMEEVQRVTGSGDFLEEVYEKIMHQLLSMQLVVKEKQIETILQAGYNLKTLQDIFTKAPNTELLGYIVAGGLNFDAGDIHLEPEGEVIKIRYRIDEILQEIASLPSSDYLPILSKIKDLSGFDSTSHEAVRDSRFGIKLEKPLPNLDAEQIDVRCSIITSGYGETVVLRLLHKSAKSLDLKKIGIRDVTIERLTVEIEKPNGIILNTGPTGSGKTTTLYSILSKLNRPEVKIITVEDPIEYRMKGILQTQVNTEEGYDFSSALRALLRQNPNILMIGEIRDEETAKIAIQAALTGHLVLSTLHTNNAVASIQRLINMNIDPSDIASATNCMMAQRLVRVLCPHCKQQKQPSPEELQKIQDTIKSISPKSGVEIPKQVDGIYEAKGCEKCKNTGYNGITPVAEVMTMSEELEELISRFSTTTTIVRQAISEGMLTMSQDGILKVLNGITTMEEVERVTEA